MRALKTVIAEKKRKLWQVKVGHTELTIECLTQGLQTGSSVNFFPTDPEHYGSIHPYAGSINPTIGVKIS